MEAAGQKPHFGMAYRNSNPETLSGDPGGRTP
jgi:hypothetical protein